MSKNEIFVCPHCQETMHIEQISFHVRNIFNYWLHKCPKCSFKSNDNFLANTHRNITGHVFEDNNGYNETIEDIIYYAVSCFVQSINYGSVGNENREENEIFEIIDERENEREDESDELSRNNVDDKTETDSIIII
uniref:C2H2-type domain-containing protein n=1 Tax=Parastrongyloides trichosuri TaxID=131310 RepID=A0A0N4Z5E8_PARTI